LTRWNDTIGEPTTPEPIDWARSEPSICRRRWHHHRVLSRLQRERVEKEMRKGS
jgi:hypothetical protein